MKMTRLLWVMVAALAFACSKDEDDAKPKLESTGLSFADGKVITPPASMLNSENEYAQMASTWVEGANSIAAYTSYFKIPSGATKSTSKITAANGRTADTGDYVVYSWTDNQTGSSVAYQVSEQSDRYTWEIFFKASKGGEWIKYIHAEEKKDRTSGFMKIFAIGSDDESLVVASYTWNRSGDIFTFVMDSQLLEMNITLKFNTKTKAGSVVYFFERVKTYEIIWDGNGNGSWKSFDDNGAVEEEGAWTV